MASMAWMDLMAPELKSERERMQWFGAHLLHPTLRIKPFVLLLFICLVGTLLLITLHSAATPKKSRSLKRVPKIGGVRADGFCKIGFVKLVKNELMDCLTKLLGKWMLGK